MHEEERKLEAPVQNNDFVTLNKKRCNTKYILHTEMRHNNREDRLKGDRWIDRYIDR